MIVLTEDTLSMLYQSYLAGYAHNSHTLEIRRSTFGRAAFKRWLHTYYPVVYLSVEKYITEDWMKAQIDLFLDVNGNNKLYSMPKT